MPPNSPGPPEITQQGITFEFPTDEVFSLLDILTNLLQQSSQLFNLLQDNILHPNESEVAILCITVIHKNIKTISHQIGSLLPRSLQYMIHKAPRVLATILHDIEINYTHKSLAASLVPTHYVQQNINIQGIAVNSASYHIHNIISVPARTRSPPPQTSIPVNKHSSNTPTNYNPRPTNTSTPTELLLRTIPRTDRNDHLSGIEYGHR
jgi:hypothetical protein